MKLNRIKRLITKGRIKYYIKKLVNKILNYKNILLTILPFLILPIYILMTNENNIPNYTNTLFNLSYIVLFTGITLNLKNRLSKIFYLIINLIFIILAFLNITNINYILFILQLLLVVYGLFKIKSKDKNNYLKLSLTIIFFLIIHSLSIFLLGKKCEDYSFTCFNNKRNLYETYNDLDKSLNISGFYEYEVRIIYFKYFKKNNTDDIKMLNEMYKEEVNTKNDYTGLLKDKNLILIEMTNMDEWLVNKDNTPTIYKMLNNSINFKNNFSNIDNENRKYDSTFTINTGFLLPKNDMNINAYSNNYPYTLANMFKNNNYETSIFIENSNNYKYLGFDNYYIVDKSGELLINNQTESILFPNNKRFFNYIKTNSIKEPFSNKSGICKIIYERDIEKFIEENEGVDNVNFTLMSEIECVKKQAKEVDNMISLLIDKLKEKEILNDTVIVLITDNYLNELSDNIIYKYKDKDLINKTPFIIWNIEIETKEIENVTSHINVIPTLLNLFDISFNNNNYLGSDALNKDYKGIALFDEKSCYEDETITNEETDYYSYYAYLKNDLTIKYNYFINN